MPLSEEQKKVIFETKTSGIDIALIFILISSSKGLYEEITPNDDANHNLNFI